MKPIAEILFPQRSSGYETRLGMWTLWWLVSPISILEDREASEYEQPLVVYEEHGMTYKTKSHVRWIWINDPNWRISLRQWMLESR